ncbi:MAG: M18 family aminopeptidase, partial [Clostridia bacterium]|nr:M18 family aminopeptidase [Clostridia bacterium]
MKTNFASELLSFIHRSPSCYHATANFRTMLLENGYSELCEAQKWELQHGGKYFVCRNGSSILAFRIPNAAPRAFAMAAAHSDAPTFKIKENAELSGSYTVRLNTEKYGGTLMSTWFDRPLSVAGRVVVKENGALKTRLVNINRDLLVIPSVAIHMNREANNGTKLAANVDTLPLYGGEDAKESFMPMIAEAAGAKVEDILGTDLFLYGRENGKLFGANNEFMISAKLDDLECAYGCMQGFLSAEPSEAIPVCCIFDNEEVGSETKQGAASSFLRDTLRRITLALGIDEEGFQQLLAKSFLVSADNAHAMHPNHPEYADAANCPQMNGGIVIKYNANQRYTTDAVSSALFKSVCAKAGVRVQAFANRSDLAGGSTLGSLANTMVP